MVLRCIVVIYKKYSQYYKYIILTDDSCSQVSNAQVTVCIVGCTYNSLLYGLPEYCLIDNNNNEHFCSILCRLSKFYHITN